MSIEQLDTVLRYVFGCQGYATNAADVVCIKRTSPSGGGLHPLEVYPIVSSVVGVGTREIYPLSQARTHSIEPVVGACSPMRPAATGQRSPHMWSELFRSGSRVVRADRARFYRSHWKYRRHPKAYASILMEAGHLSQTLYLVSADLELGAYGDAGDQRA